MALNSESGSIPLRLRTLGGLSVEGADAALGAAATQRKALALLAVLAHAGPRGVSRDRLLALLWPEASADRAPHRLTQLIYSLRHDLGTPELFLGASELRLNPAVCASDLEVFGAALATGDLERAVAAYTGSFLDGFFLTDAPEFERWADEGRAELARQHAAAVESLARTATRRGDHTSAAGHWGALTRADPLNSRVVAAYVESAAAAGDRAGALRAAQAHEALLREELDTGPTVQFREAVERVRAGAVGHPAPIPAVSIAVLPFLNLSPERENEYFSDGMTEELTNALARVQGLRVASRTSAFTFKACKLDVREIAERLGVGALVEGSVRKVGDRIRLTAQLVSAVDGCHLWSETYERTLADVFELQEQLAATIARALPLGLGANMPVASPGTRVVEAYTLYLRGRYFAQRRTVDGLRAGLEYFEQAVERDPGYALAYAGIAECWTLLGFEEFGDVAPREAMPRAKAAAERALAINPFLAEGHHWSGVVTFLYEYDWQRAEAALRRALELSPRYSPAHMWHAVLLSAVGRHEEALARIQGAEALDPLSFPIQIVTVHALHYAGRHDEAVARCQALLDIEPHNPRAHWWLARTYSAMGRPTDALAAAERAMASSGRHPAFLMSAGVALAALGRKAEAHAILAELRAAAGYYVSPTFCTAILAALGLRAETMASLRQSLEERAGHLAFIRSAPRWAVLRGDPEFEAFLREIHPPA